MSPFSRQASILAFVATLLPATASLAAQQEAAPALSPERLERAYADAVAACAKDYGRALDPEVPMRLATAKEIVDAFVAELLPTLIHRLGGKEAEAKQAARARVAGVRGLVHAKYTWHGCAILVDEAAMRRTARDLAMPELLDDEALRAMLVHEVCHAHDDRRFDFAARMAQIPDDDQLSAFTAVVEGHAQLRARRICGRSGWSQGFTKFTEAIGKVPPRLQQQGEAVAMQARIAAANTRFAYDEGERFVAAVLAKDPERGGERIFLSPPSDTSTVSSPTWFLDPSSRPKLQFDPEPALDHFLSTCAPSEWTMTRAGMPARQLAATLSLLPAEEVNALLASVRNVRIGSATSPAQDRQVTIAALEFADDAATVRWLDAMRRLGTKKDETMKTGAERIVASTTTEIAEANWQGLLQVRTIRAGDSDIPVASLIARRGCVVFETALIGSPPDDATHVALMRTLLDKLRRTS